MYHLSAVEDLFVRAVQWPRAYAVRQIRLRPQVSVVGLLAAELLAIATFKATAMPVPFAISAVVRCAIVASEVFLAQVMLWWSSKKWLPLHL